MPNIERTFRHRPAADGEGGGVTMDMNHLFNALSETTSAVLYRMEFYFVAASYMGKRNLLYNFFFRNRNELAITETEDRLIAAPARTGGKMPTAASGMLKVL